MAYDIIFVTGEVYFDHPLCGIAIIKRLLERHGYSVGLIEMPKRELDVTVLGAPRLFFGVSSGSIDSMVRNYTPLKKLRRDDRNLDYNESVPDRAVIVYSNWIKRHFKDAKIVLGGTEASLRRFVHYDYWENRLRKPVLLDSRADILAYGCAEKQIIEIADRISKKKNLLDIPGTCIIGKEAPEGFLRLPDYEEVMASKERFCDMQLKLDNNKDLCQKIDNRYVLQNKSPQYTTRDLDSYYELPFSRNIPVKHLRGFEFSVVTHRGCIGECSFCSLKLMQGNRIISRSEQSILKEIENMKKLPYFKGNIDDLGGPSANMYGMDCSRCEDGHCIDCNRLDQSNKKLISLLRKARKIKGIKKINIRTGIRYDLASDEYLKEVARHHIYDTLKIAPEHVNKKVLRLMNKDNGDLNSFIKRFKMTGTDKELSFYFMTAHPGSGMPEAEELGKAIAKLKNTETVQVFTPTPMTDSTCMYYTGLDPRTKKPVYVPYTYNEKKKQKRVLFSSKYKNTSEDKRLSKYKNTSEDKRLSKYKNTSEDKRLSEEPGKDHSKRPAARIGSKRIGSKRDISCQKRYMQQKRMARGSQKVKITNGRGRDNKETYRKDKKGRITNGKCDKITRHNHNRQVLKFNNVYKQ
ncbi:YgiQ family radical SAM protein [Candidatus Woesearchaeota archaeon]|nr:YgiQ family radical SAM protein [Candidatus Woesearchaeota archaeon]